MWTVFSVSQSGLLKSVVISEACKVEGVIHILSNLLYMSVVLNCVNTAWNIMILNLVACKVFVHTQMCQQSTQIQISRADSSCLFKCFSPCWRFEFGTVFACCATRFSRVHARLLVVMSQYVNSLHHSVRRGMKPLAGLLVCAIRQVHLLGEITLHLRPVITFMRIIFFVLFGCFCP